ncbi:MAG TPA: hypothetical protein VFR12_06175, partial [Pyrinomonadaceae bacterium]|nr:hypothetical protein [Pyrinomonadaceae bacterium]
MNEELFILLLVLLLLAALVSAIVLPIVALVISIRSRRKFSQLEIRLLRLETMLGTHAAPAPAPAPVAAP